MAESGIPASQEQKQEQHNQINNLLKKSLKKGEVRYLVDSRWFKQWKRYVGQDSWSSDIAGEQSSHPGPIDNSSLFKENTNEIREYLSENLDFEFMPKEAYDLLVSWYGVMEFQEPIVRNVVENGSYVKLCVVELYLLELKLCLNNDLEGYITQKFSKADTIEHLELFMRKHFEIPHDKQTRLWSRYASYTFEQLTKKDITISEASLFSSQLILIEVQEDDGSWPRSDQSLHSLSSSSTSASDNRTYGGSSSAMSSRFIYYAAGTAGDSQPGLCGLSNLGNTCFMNSALQCMVNTPPITRYFLQDRYFDELNTENPLGMKGEIAKTFGELAKIMWSGNYTCTYPRNFKMQVGRFAPQFSGYQQQDSQELMAFLLDGLHEDLNRIKKKPYIEQKEVEGRADEEVAREAWENYRKRNDSIIVDIFHGLLKSTLVCPECNKVSVTFDPFCYVTLPLPIKKERQIEVFFLPQDPTVVTMQYKLTVPKSGVIRDLCYALGQLTDVTPNKMIVADVFNHRFHKIYQPEESLNGIMERDCIFIFEVPVSPQEGSDMVALPVYMRQKHVWSGCSREGRASYQIFGQPFVVRVPAKTCTYGTLYEAILHRMTRYVRIPSPEEEWWSAVKSENAVNGEMETSNGDEGSEESDSPADDDNKEEDEGIDSEESDTAPSGSPANAHAGSAAAAAATTELRAGHDMFTMHFVNSSGTSDVSRLRDDGNPIKFTYQPYLAINWHTKAKKLFYDEKKADALNQHETAITVLRPPAKKQVIQLNECLELFTATERLSAEDSWYCPSCKKHQQATKKFDLWALPQVLVLCFKRFSYNRYNRDKLDALVEFPIRNLNMSKYIISPNHHPAIYDLIAVSNHYGGMGGGHYTALAKNKDDQKWYNFDDSSVSPVKEETVVSKAAYVLFYMLRDGRDASAAPAVHRDIPAAQGTPGNAASESSEDEDCSMETN